MEIFDNLISSAKNFFRTSSRLRITVVLLLIFFVTAAFITATVESLSVPGEKKKGIQEGGDFVPPESFFLPPEKTLTDDYYFSRETGSAWSEEDVKKYFTVPDQSFIESLSDSNRKTADDILGAAP